MAWDEEDVRTLLLDAELPPSRLDVDELLVAGQRSYRRWRRMTATGAVVAAVAVTVPAVVVATGHWPSRSTPDRFAEFASSAAVTHRASSIVDMAPCTTVSFRTDEPEVAPIVDTDATGELAVASGYGERSVTLWTKERPSTFAVPDASASLAPVAVNSAGVVVGTGADGWMAGNWSYRSGEVRRLPTPAGHATGTVRELNETGDALGVLGSPPGLVVWPAEGPDSPRVIDGSDLEPLGLRDDGTVVTTGTDRLRAPALVFIRPDGSRRTVRIPSEITGLDAGITRDRFGFVRGDVLFATAWVGAASHPLRWNLRTGVVEIFDSLTGPVTAGTAGGWLMATDGNRAVAVSPDGVASRLAAPGSVVWVSAGGTVMIANTPTGPVTWRC